MGFRDFPFVAVEDDELRDPRRFPGHREVLMYLRDFAKAFGIEKLVRFETEVESMSLVMAENETRWRVRSKKRGDLVRVEEEVFDAVVVCNGHYSEPRVAEIPGIEMWPGKQIHSHNYRAPEPYRYQVVILIGSSESAFDISRDIARVAKEVHVASRSADGMIGKLPGYDNVWLHSKIKSTHKDGSVVFHDESVVFADVILHCTGYKYNFPFLETDGVVTVDDNRVGPLYKHVFPPALAPWLSFVGLPRKIIAFPLCELQSKWIAGILSNRIELPSEEKMMEDIDEFYSMLEASSRPKRYTHQMLGSDPFEYVDWLADQCCCSLYEEWRKEMHKCVSKRKRVQPDSYKDEWDDEEWILRAHHEFKSLLSKGLSS